MGKRIVHVETRIQTTFALVDDTDVLQQYTVVAQAQDAQGKPVDDPLLIRKFTQEAWDRAYETINKVRVELDKNANN